jgi:hypothetical protein
MSLTFSDLALWALICGAAEVLPEAEYVAKKVSDIPYREFLAGEARLALTNMLSVPNEKLLVIIDCLLTAGAGTRPAVLPGATS